MHMIHAIVLGVVEGVTEFLPISSTAHLLLAQKFMGILQSDAIHLFNIVVQFAAILAIVVYAPRRLITNRKTQIALIAAFIPTVIIGFSLKHQVDVLQDMIWVSVGAIFFGGIVMVLLEKFWKPKQQKSIDELTISEAATIGAVQSLAMIPGISRSAATIYGGLMKGLTRKEAVAFSFYLAIPTMAGASVLSLAKYKGSYGADVMVPVLVGCLIAFITAYLAVSGFLRYIERHGFAAFGWYRIFLGVILCMLAIMGIF